MKEKLVGSFIFATVSFLFLIGTDILVQNVSIDSISVVGSIVKFIGLVLLGYIMQSINFKKKG